MCEREGETLNTETTKKNLILDAFLVMTVRKHIIVNPIPNANCHPVWSTRQTDHVISLNGVGYQFVRKNHAYAIEIFVLNDE